MADFTYMFSLRIPKSCELCTALGILRRASFDIFWIRCFFCITIDVFSGFRSFNYFLTINSSGENF